MYDDNGREVQHVSPDAISSYYEYYDGTLYVSMHNSQGLIKVKEYYSGIAGQPDGALFKEFVKKGSNGTPILVKKHEYLLRTIHDSSNNPLQTAWFPAKVTQYANEDGTGAVETEFSYDFEPNSLKMIQKTTMLPAVSAAHNGTGLAATRVERFDDHGRLIWLKDELGIVTYHEYNLAQGVRTKTIQDALLTQTADFIAAVPSGWATVSGAGKHLVSEFEYDSQGRMIQSLAPKNSAVNDSNESITVRPANWTVYDDVNHKTMSASGYATLDSNGLVTGYTLVNPVSITKRDLSGNVLEQIQAARVQTTGKLSATDTFEQSSYTAWTKHSYDAFGKVLSTRQYFAIPSSGDGTKDVNYLETSFGYDARGRQNRSVSPDGTISRTVYDWRGNATQTWIGTGDTGATDTAPRSGNAANNMLLVSETEYGSGGGCSTCNGSQEKPRVMIQHVDANTMRVTELGYDWRGRQTHVHGEEDTDGNLTYSVQTYDNMNRAVKSERFVPGENSDTGGSGSYNYSSSGSGGYSSSGSSGYSSSGSSSGSSGGSSHQSDEPILLERTEQFYDERGRVWKTEHSVVSPQNGSVQGKLTQEFWYDAAGRVVKQTEPGTNHVIENIYDSLGRIEKSFVKVGEAVLAQSETLYDALGNAIVQTQIERLSTATSTGALTLSTGR